MVGTPVQRPHGAIPTSNLHDTLYLRPAYDDGDPPSSTSPSAGHILRTDETPPGFVAESRGPPLVRRVVTRMCKRRCQHGHSGRAKSEQLPAGLPARAGC